MVKYKVFQIVSRVKELLSVGGNLRRRNFDQSKLKTSVKMKMKISMTYVYREYEVKIRIVHE